MVRLDAPGDGPRLAVKDCIDVAGLPTTAGCQLIAEQASPAAADAAVVAGLPAPALPVPGGPAGLPASLQLLAPPGGEEQLVALGRTIESALH